jgi:hypothetical protein
MYFPYYILHILNWYTLKNALCIQPLYINSAHNEMVCHKRWILSLISYSLDYAFFIAFYSRICSTQPLSELGCEDHQLAVSGATKPTTCLVSSRTDHALCMMVPSQTGAERPTFFCFRFFLIIYTT